VAVGVGLRRVSWPSALPVPLEQAVKAAVRGPAPAVTPATPATPRIGRREKIRRQQALPEAVHGVGAKTGSAITSAGSVRDRGGKQASKGSRVERQRQHQTTCASPGCEGR